MQAKDVQLDNIFTTRELRTCLPVLKSSFDSYLNSQVVYELSCCGCNSTYVGQTCRHLATKTSEHQKTDSLVGQNVVVCCGALSALNCKIIDQCQESKKLLTIEAVQISRRQPQLNTRDEYKSRELILKY